MIRVHVEAEKNTNSVMGRIRVETMKFHPLNLRPRVEAMTAKAPGKAPFYAGFRKIVDMFPRTSGASDIKMDVSSHVESIVLLSKLKSNMLKHINVELEMDEFDLTAAESKAIYQEIKDYVLKQSGLKVSNLCIAG